MRIKITLIDEQNGSVRIDCNPPIPKLIEAWRGGDKNPALAYAIAGIEKMMAFSRDVETEREKELQERAMMNGLIIPDPRIRAPKQQGPSEVL